MPSVLFTITIWKLLEIFSVSLEHRHHTSQMETGSIIQARRHESYLPGIQPKSTPLNNVHELKIIGNDPTPLRNCSSNEYQTP